MNRKYRLFLRPAAPFPQSVVAPEGEGIALFRARISPLLVPIRVAAPIIQTCPAGLAVAFFASLKVDQRLLKVMPGLVYLRIGKGQAFEAD